VGAAVAPSKVGLSSPRPEDFDAFWESRLAAQSKIPINPMVTPVQSGIPGVDLNMFVLDALGSKARGYVAKPAREGKFPAIIQLQYAGVYALNAGAVAQRAAAGWLVINVDGLIPIGIFTAAVLALPFLAFERPTGDEDRPLF
jgi:cephalosporin-C deacetylase